MSDSRWDRAMLEAAHCWFDSDNVSGRPDVTAFRRLARLHQATWRESKNLPMGSHRAGKSPVERKNGSRIVLEEAKASEANFLSPRIRSAVHHRLDSPQPHQMLKRPRLWSDLLSSMPMCFNLFGELHDDPSRVSKIVAALWPSAPVKTGEVVFEWSPGRRKPDYLNDRTAFDAAIRLKTGEHYQGILGIETKYHEDARTEEPPNPDTRLPRYREVTERSEAFKSGWEQAILGTELQQLWRDHLLVLAMLQHPGQKISFGRYVLVHPAGNPSFAEAGKRYRELLADGSTFEVRTIENLLDAHVLHDPAVEAAFRDRYIFDPERNA